MRHQIIFAAQTNAARAAVLASAAPAEKHIGTNYFGALICNAIDGEVLNVMTTGLLSDFCQARRRKSGIESRVFVIRVAVLLRSVGDLVLKMARLMIPAELAQRRLV